DIVLYHFFSFFCFFFSSRRRHTRSDRDWSSDVCSSDLFTAYDHMAKEDLHLIAHLGDYIYEYAGAENQVRKYATTEVRTMDQYRSEERRVGKEWRARRAAEH